MPPQAATRLSVVIVTYNSSSAVTLSLPALCEQLEPEDELVVVDNASTDGTIGVVRELAPRATVISSARNAGFAPAANIGAGAATGDVLLFLNPDATPAAGFATAIRAPFVERDWSAWMGLVTADDGRRVNTNGGVIHYTGIAWAGEAGAPAPGSATAPRETPFLSGACLAVRRADWDRVGGFDDAFFMYQEDVDLSLRLRLTGGRLGVEPAAVVDHDYEFDKGSMKWRLLERNRWATIVRCYPTPLLLLLAPALGATEAALLAVAAAGGWLPEKLAATGETLAALPRLLRERRSIQSRRAISSREFASWLTPDLTSPFLGRAGHLRPLRWGLRAYWQVVLAVLRDQR